MIFVAGIGSRETPQNILNEMKKIGEWVRETKNFYITSGHAEGADWAFEQGAQERCIVYCPWSGFNQHLKSNANAIIPPTTQKAKDITEKYHPAPGKLSEGAMKLHCRNSYQVLGNEVGECFTAGISPLRVKAVVCWTSDGKASGGTGQAVRIAQGHKIPILNMHNTNCNTANKVIAFLQALNCQKCYV